VKPALASNAHRPLGTHRLEQILSVRVARSVASDHTVKWDGQRWGVPREQVRAGLRGAHVEIERRLDGSHWLRFCGDYLPLQPCDPVTSARTCGRKTETPKQRQNQNQIPCVDRTPLEKTMEADISTLR
jgi:hypothetical protein